MLNVNSFDAKFDSTRWIVILQIDVMVLVETKLDDTYIFPSFLWGGYFRPFRRDMNRHGWGYLD